MGLASFFGIEKGSSRMGFALVNGVSVKNAPLEQNPFLHEISQNDKRGNRGKRGGDVGSRAPQRKLFLSCRENALSFEAPWAQF